MIIRPGASWIEGVAGGQKKRWLIRC